MRRLLGLMAVVLVATSALAGCSSPDAASDASTSVAVPRSWSTPQNVVDGLKAAGFDCTLPTSDTVGQILTKDPFTGTDLGGNALVRCPDFQVMLAADSVEEGFSLLAACQVIPDTVKQSPEWTEKVIVGRNFVILPADLTTGWVATAQPADFTNAFGGTVSTFGELYEKSCAGKTAASPSAPAPSPASS